MCELAQLSRAGFYRHWLQKEPDLAMMKLRDAVQRASLANRFYGYRRVTAQLRIEGITVSQKVVRRIMKEDELLAIRRRRFAHTTDSRHNFRVYPNLAQYMELNMPNQLWVADITYIRLETEFVFLAVVLDAWSRRAIGWQAGGNLNTSLAMAALRQAIQARNPPAGLVHHSDGGSQYASHEYVRELTGTGAILSMSRPGRPWENGRCESFIRTLKQEEIDARCYRSLEELGKNVEDFLENVYNTVRLHSALQYRSPAEFERTYNPSQSWRPAPMRFDAHDELTG